jgi:hypothetical protein
MRIRTEKKLNIALTAIATVHTGKSKKYISLYLPQFSSRSAVGKIKQNNYTHIHTIYIYIYIWIYFHTTTKNMVTCPAEAELCRERPAVNYQTSLLLPRQAVGACEPSNRTMLCLPENKVSLTSFSIIHSSAMYHTLYNSLQHSLSLLSLLYLHRSSPGNGFNAADPSTSVFTSLVYIYIYITT